MRLVTLNTISVGWAVASALAVAGLGVIMLKGGRSRPRGALPFGLFALLWGIEIASVNLAGLVGAEGTAELLYLTALVAYLPMAYFLVEAAASQSRKGPLAFPWRAIRWVAAALALVGATLFVLAPSTLFEGVARFSGAWSPMWGPAFAPVVQVPVFVAFGLAIVALWRWLDHAPTERTRVPSTAILAGLSLYAGFAASNNLVVFAGLLEGLPSLTTSLYLAVFAGLILLLLALGSITLLSGFGASTRAERQRAHWLSAALLVPIGWGAIEGLLVLGPLAPHPWFQSVGLWRLAGVAAIGYGVVRWRVHDLPERVHRGASAAVGTAGAVAGGATVYGVGSLTLASASLPLLGGFGVTALTIVPGLRLARRLLGPDETNNPVEHEERVFEQRVEAYRAALEDAMARGRLDEEEGFLEALRDRFDISEREDRILRYYARTATVATREGDERDSYDRLRLLGEGGAGRTWLARDRTRDRLVVLKEPLERWQREPAILQATREEAQLAANVRHPNVVDVEEVLEDDGRPVIVMEHVDGGSLADLLRSKGVLPWRRAVSVVHDVLKGLAAVHDAGIVHRDIKPANILLTEDGVAKISDFGIAVRTGGDGTQIEGGSPTPGTTAYMAPEARAGRSGGGVRGDVYGCAAVLHACLHGSPPGKGAVKVDNGVPAELEAVLARGLAEDPEQRFPTASAFAAELAEVARS